jgi:mono/diheme cytochrome c family protein
MVMSIAFALAVVLGMTLYILNDNNRATQTAQTKTDEAAHKGAQLYAANCSQCHGPLGEGGVGPALNRPNWHPGNKDFDLNATTDFLTKVLVRGQASPQPGISMPAWSRQYGGALTDEQIEFLVAFIIHGEWEEVLKVLPYTQSPNYEAELPPNSVQKAKYPDFEKNTSQGQEQKKQLNAELSSMKKLILDKACLNCHAIGSAGTTLGPNLSEVGSRRTRDWLYKWIEDPAKVPGTDRGPNVKPWFDMYSTPRTEFWPMNPSWMPAVPMTAEERNRITDYLANLKLPPVVVKSESN